MTVFRAEIVNDKEIRFCCISLREEAETVSTFLLELF